MAVLRGKAASIVKKEVGYDSNPEHPCCKNCKHLWHHRVRAIYDGAPLEWDNAFQCSLNHIAVGKNAICTKYEFGTPTFEIVPYAG